jgi:hypothetical protein
MSKNKIIMSNDAKETNFREIRMGHIAPHMLYRSSHPIKDNKQYAALALLATNARIAAVINLADTNSSLAGKIFLAPWYSRLAQGKQVITLGMGFSITGDNFYKKLKKGLRFIISTLGPWLLHCYAGVDRTGFVAMVLEAFMGASLDEITGDYLMSFNSGFESSIYGDSHKADSLAAMKLLSAMSASLINNNQNVQSVVVMKLLTIPSARLSFLQKPSPPARTAMAAIKVPFSIHPY